MTFLRHLFENPIRAFALLCVALTSGLFAYFAYWLIEILSSPDWCSKAIQAERITPGNTFVGLTTCVELLKMQLSALALNSHIVIGTFALCLGVLVIIVIAGARLAGKIFGNEFDVSRQDAARAAKQAAEAAAEEANEIRGG